MNNTGTLPFIVSGTNVGDYLLATADNITFVIDAVPTPNITVLPALAYTAGQGVFGFSSNIEGNQYCSMREGVFSNDSNPISY